MLTESFSLTIDNASPETAHTVSVINPATETIIAEAPAAGAGLLDAAVSSARAAFLKWRARPYAERQEAVRRIGEVLTANAERLAPILTAEQGKPLAAAQREIQRAGSWCAQAATLSLPIDVTEDSPQRRAVTQHTPIGVVAAVVPWNFPILLAIGKIAPALLAGNTIILKPSPFTPLATLKLGELLRAALPPGVLNVISGGDELGPLLTAHPGIDKISFTGSTATGKRVLAGAATDLKRVTLELGGNDAAIIMPDVDIARVAELLFWSAFHNTGQVCIATKRMFVHDDVYKSLSDAMVEIAKRARVGNGMDEGVMLGPIQNKPQFERVQALMAETKQAGHRILFQGAAPQGKGYFAPVVLVDSPPDDSRAVREEAFGPILPLLRFSKVEDAVARANDSEFGLGGSVWCADPDKAADIAAQLETGSVWINEIQNTSPFTAFGGHRASGFGLEHGVHGLLEFTNPKTILTGKTAVA